VSQARRKAWTWLVNRWEQPEGSPKRFTARELAEANGMNIHTAKRFLQFLIEKERVCIYKRGGDGKPTLYHLKDASPLVFDQPRARKGYRVKAQRTHKRITVRQRVWNSCRILRVFTLNELAATAQAAYVTCGAYVKRLEKAGLVRKVKRHAAQPGEYAVFRLNTDAGAEHPVVRDDGIWCPSIQTLYPYKGAQNERLD